MAALIVVLRAMHIVGGVFWAGGAIVMNGFVLPSVTATRPESGKFMQHLAGASGLTQWMLVASLATVIGGLVMFGPVTGGFDPGVMGSRHGIALSVGAVFALAAFVEGGIVLGPTARRMGAMGAAIAKSGGPPSPEQARELGTMQARFVRVGRRGAVMLGLAATLMAVARYL